MSKHFGWALTADDLDDDVASLAYGKGVIRESGEKGKSRAPT
jgi:hypothetical protein